MTESSLPDAEPTDRWEWGALLGFALLVVITRVPLWGEYFYDWDAVQFGMALDDYDIAAHRPHPPGYLFYIGLARGVRALGCDAHHALLVLGLSFTLVGLVAVWRLARVFGGPHCGIAAAVLWTFNPVVWFYGIVGESYAAEAAFSALIGLAAVRCLRSASGSVLVLSLLVGLCGGVRTSVTLFSLPLWLYCLIRSRRSAREWLVACAALGAGVLAWIAPTAWLSGGLGEYSSTTRSLVWEASGRTWSLFFGADPAFVLHNLRRCLYWSAAIVNLAGLVAAAAWLVLRLRRGGRATPEPSEWRPPTALAPFALVWSVPALLFFLLVFAVKPGHFLYLAPAVMVATSVGLVALARALGARRRRALLAGVLTVLAAVDISLFLDPVVELRRPTALDVSYADLRTESYLEAFDRLAADRPADRTVVVYGLGGLSWRVGCYYRPELVGYLIHTPQTMPNHRPGYVYCACHHRKTRCVPPVFMPRDELIPAKVDVWLPPAVERVVWAMREPDEIYHRASSQLPMGTHRTERGMTVWFSDVAGELPLTLGGARLMRAPPGRDPVFDRGGEPVPAPQ